MRKNIMMAGLLMIFALAACAQSRKASSRTHKKIKTSHTTSASPRVTAVYMMRTPCFGRCPNYVVIINSNGMVEYQGRRFTKYTGVYQKTVGTGRTQPILDQFMAYRVDTCSEQYPNLISDIPGIYYKITIDGRVKTINNAHFGPKFLKQMAILIDEVADVDGTWKQTNDVAPNE